MYSKFDQERVCYCCNEPVGGKLVVTVDKPKVTYRDPEMFRDAERVIIDCDPRTTFHAAWIGCGKMHVSRTRT